MKVNMLRFHQWLLWLPQKTGVAEFLMIWGMQIYSQNMETHVALRAAPSLQLDRVIISYNGKEQPTIKNEHLHSIVIKHAKM